MHGWITTKRRLKRRFKLNVQENKGKMRGRRKTYISFPPIFPFPLQQTSHFHLWTRRIGYHDTCQLTKHNALLWRIHIIQKFWIDIRRPKATKHGCTTECCPWTILPDFVIARGRSQVDPARVPLVGPSGLIAFFWLLGKPRITSWVSLCSGNHVRTGGTRGIVRYHGIDLIGFLDIRFGSWFLIDHANLARVLTKSADTSIVWELQAV